MINNHKYFGTDGIRGRVGRVPITPDFIFKLGLVIGKILKKRKSNKILIGKDTRISGSMIKSALESGLSFAGKSTAFIGTIPTPAVAYLTRFFKADAGISISASHNPFYDNGIKFFSSEGKKFTDKIEKEIEKEISKPLNYINTSKFGNSIRLSNASDIYIEFCKSTFPNYLSLKGLKIVVDCANGSTYRVAPIVLQELGSKLIIINSCPNGKNINYKCGTTDIRMLQNTVLLEKADVGIAYDGDGDRVIMVDHLGNKIDGDQILYILTKEKIRKGRLIGGVVGTVMSNMGLEIALKKLNIPFIRSSVGDRYIVEKMNKMGWNIGAENSGHVILLDKTTTGDGIISCLQVLSAMIANQISLYELCEEIHLLPQILINVHTSGIHNPLKSITVKQFTSKVALKLSGKGRVILRKSGTEPFVRIMVEGENINQISSLAYSIADVVKNVDYKKNYFSSI